MRCEQNSITCTYKNGKYSEIIIGGSLVTCDEVIEVTRTAYLPFMHYLLFPELT